MAQRDLLCCEFDAFKLAVPLERVIGVVEGGPVTPLPFTFQAFEGLVEAIGQVMPQVSLAATLNLEASAGGMLVVVSHMGGSLALRVPKVSTMISVDAEQFLASAQAARAVNSLYMAEVTHQDSRYYVLDLDLLADSEDMQPMPPEGEVLLAEARGVGTVAEETEDTRQVFLMMRISGELYAVANSAIGEINIPHLIRPIPKSPDWIMGMIDLRGRPVLAISASALLGQPVKTDVQDPVCLITGIEDGKDVALVVDRVLGLERIAQSHIHAMPQSMAGVESYFILGQDEIIGILDPKALTDQVLFTLRDWLPASEGAHDTAGMIERGTNFRQLLALRVGEELFGLTLDRIERIQASVELTPLPENIQFFDGLADVGEAVIPVIDLRRQVGHALRSFDSTGSPPCVMTRLEGALTGLLVDQVLSILDVAVDSFEDIKNASRLPISHVVNHQGRMISVLVIDRLLPAHAEMLSGHGLNSP
jgi:purine-binding chemotaxis protein CheW